MGTFEEAANKVKNVASSAGEIVNTVLEKTKINFKVMDIQGEIKSDYEKLGRILYNCRKVETDLSEEIDEIIEQIDKKYAQIEELNNTLLTLRKIKKCPNCGKENSIDNEYCSACGFKFGQEADVKEEAE